MGILNGSVVGDEKGEYTYVGSNGDTVIDYVISGKEVREKIQRLEAGDRIDSDHQLLIVYVEEKRTREKGSEEGKRKEKVWNWTEVGKERYRERTEV